MSAVQFDVEYKESRNRLTSAFRMILAIPHFMVASAWQSLAQVLTVIQWFIVLFTGKRNDGIWKMQSAWLAYAARAYTYAGLMYDPYPPFGTEAGQTGATFEFEQPTEVNRLSNALRIIWAIPALIISFVLTFVAVLLVIVSWFAILFTGRHPRGMFDFMLKAHRYAIRTNSYAMLMTDTYPKVE